MVLLSFIEKTRWGIWKSLFLSSKLKIINTWAIPPLSRPLSNWGRELSCHANRPSGLVMLLDQFTIKCQKILDLILEKHANVKCMTMIWVDKSGRAILNCIWLGIKFNTSAGSVVHNRVMVVYKIPFLWSITVWPSIQMDMVSLMNAQCRGWTWGMWPCWFFNSFR